MKKVLVWGTFDILHLGHLDFLEAAKRKGERLVVLVGADKIVKKVKGRAPLHSQKERLRMVKSLRVVDEAYADRPQEDFLMLKRIRPKVICLGYDQVVYTDKLPGVLKKFKLRSKIIRLKSYRPQKYKTTNIKDYIIGGERKKRAI